MTVVASEVINAIRAHAEHHYPHESCGVLAGRGDRIERFYAARNIVAERKHDRYDLHPADHIAAEKDAERAGLEVIGFFHSHPDHAAVPSEFDRSRAWEGYTYLIGEIRKGRLVSLRAWSLRSGAFVELLEGDEEHAKSENTHTIETLH